MNAIRTLEQLGQSIWYDNISRSLLRSGGLRKMIREDGLLGVTSNPSIFEKAIAGSDDYDAELRAILARDPATSVADVIQTLMVSDIRAAADDLREVYDRTGGRDWYVSVEVTPAKARDSQATIEEVRLLWRRIDRPNLMVKIPATREGLSAIEQAVSEGMNINVTLIFSVELYREVANAYIAGLERRHRRQLPLAQVASVASVFVSRVDTLVDEMLQAKMSALPDRSGVDRLRGLLGRAAVANTRIIYQAFKESFLGPRFRALGSAGARLQRPLWGSTSTKNPSYSDLLYVETLIGPHTVNTVPPVTYEAILDHLRPSLSVEEDLTGAQVHMRTLEAEGIDIALVMRRLEEDGVAAFEKSFDGLYRNLASKREQQLQTATAR